MFLPGIFGYKVSWLPPFIGKRVDGNRSVSAVSRIPLDLDLDLSRMVSQGGGRCRDRRGAVVYSTGIAFRIEVVFHFIRQVSEREGFNLFHFWWANIVA